MKLCLFLCATGAALAAQDAPPEISLDLSALEYKDRNCASPHSECTQKIANNGTSAGYQRVAPSTLSTTPGTDVAAQNTNQKFHSVTCEVGAGASTCPLPTCQAFDHHDLHCDATKTATYSDCVAAGASAYCHAAHATVTDPLSAVSQQNVRSGSSTYSTACTHHFSCDRPTFTPIQIDQTTYDQDAAHTDVSYSSTNTPADDSQMNAFEARMRDVRSEWVLTFGASDTSGNAAQQISFTMVFQDTKAPNLVTQFETNQHTHDLTNNNHFTKLSVSPNTYESKTGTIRTDSFAESCTECGTTVGNINGQAAASCAAPCTYVLQYAASQLSSTDGYQSENCTSNIEVTNVGRAANDKDSFAELDDAFMSVNTQTQGDWVVRYDTHDNAGIFGYEEQDNELSQTVTVRISDNTPPEIYLNPYPTPDLSTDADYPKLQIDTSGSDQTGMDKLFLQCDKTTSKWTDPSSRCLDLRASWDAANTQYDSSLISVNDDVGSIANLAANGKVISATDAGNVHVVTYDCNDGADTTFNGRAAANKNSITRTVTVQDTIDPVVTLIGPTTVQNSAGTHMHETNQANANNNARFENGTNPNRASGLPNVDAEQFGFFDAVEYGVGASRVNATYGFLDDTSVSATDTYGFGGETQSDWKGATCADTCESTPTLIATLHTTSCDGPKVTHDAGTYEDGDLRNFNQDKIEYSAHGSQYYIRYTCFDGNAGDERQRRAVHTCRTIDHVDRTQPIIQILGSDSMDLEATHEHNYVDDGAACYDQVDGVISQNVEVSGDVVNLSKVGRYTVTYNCKDAAGNAADPISRTVTVKQTGCPSCTILSCAGTEDDTNSTAASQETNVPGTCGYKQRHEASFAYVDAGAQCSDEIDGSLQVSVFNDVNVEAVGEYVVTYHACNSVGLCTDSQKRLGNTTTAYTCPTGGGTYRRTVVIVDTLKPVLSVSYGGKQVAAGIAGDVPAYTGSYAGGETLENIADDWARDATAGGQREGYDSGRHTEYMAESSSTSGAWLWAAAAAATAGLALLAHGQRRAVATSVPV